MRNLKSQLIFSTHISSWNVSHSHILASQSSLPSSLRHRRVLSRIYCNLNIWNHRAGCHDDIFFLLPACLLPHIRATLQRSYEEKRVRLFLLTIPSPSEMIWNTLWIMKLKRASKRECKRKKYEKFINIPARVCCVFFLFYFKCRRTVPLVDCSFLMMMKTEEQKKNTREKYIAISRTAKRTLHMHMRWVQLCSLWNGIWTFADFEYSMHTVEAASHEQRKKEPILLIWIALSFDCINLL